MHYISFASQITMANSKVILLRNATQPSTLQESMDRKSNNTWNSIRMMCPALGEWSYFIKVSGKYYSAYHYLECFCISLQNSTCENTTKKYWFRYSQLLSLPHAKTCASQNSVNGFKVNDPLTEVVVRGVCGFIWRSLKTSHNRRMPCFVTWKFENTRLNLNIQNLCWFNYQANIHSTLFNLYITHHSGNCANTTYISSGKRRFILQWRSAPVGQEFSPKTRLFEVMLGMEDKMGKNNKTCMKLEFPTG